VLTLPARHTPQELTQARRLAEYLELSELHVYWSAPAPGPAPGERHLFLEALSVVRAWARDVWRVRH
jgi:hypothetical protein